MLALLLFLVALVLFALATVGVGSRFNLIAGGLFCWCLATALPLLRGL